MEVAAAVLLGLCLSVERHLWVQVTIARAETSQTEFEVEAQECPACGGQKYLVRAIDKGSRRIREAVLASQARPPIQLHAAPKRLVLIYDLTASPEANRLAPAPHNDPRSVGWPVFRPLETPRPYEFLTGKPEESGGLTLRSPCWSGDRFLLFTYWIPSEGNQLVIVDLILGVQQARHFVLLIDPDVSPQVKEILREPIAVKSLRVENGSVILTTHREYSGIDGTTLTIDVVGRLPSLRGL
ncbi:MAG TPA: hypothetical protein PLP42_18225 [Acidobacteriota bacterium]|nr:hypothetical protein [Acidobacteriota bacterium]